MHSRNSTTPLDATVNHDRRYMTDAERDDALNARLDTINKQIGSASSPDDKPVSRSADRIHTVDTTTEHREPQLYAVIDSVTNQIIGGIQLHLNHASAIRAIRDIALGDTIVQRHPLDFDLYHVGSLTRDNRILPTFARLVTGAQLKAIVDAAHSTERKS